MILSVIVPIFNSENYLRAMLDSIALQDMKNCELILIDDGSTDSSGTICDSFAEKYSYIKVFHIENKGVSNARNLAISVSSGEYVMFLDSDDYIFENAIDIYKNSIIRNRCDLIISKSKRINTLKNTEIDIGPAENEIYKNRNDISKFLDRLDNESDRWVLDYVWNKAYKKEIILKNKLQFSVDCSLGEDFLFNCKYLSYINSMELITHLSYCYTIRGGGLSRAFYSNIIEWREIQHTAHIELLKSFNINSPKHIQRIDIYDGMLMFAAFKNNGYSKLDKSNLKTHCIRVIQSPLYASMLVYIKSKKKLHTKILYLMMKTKSVKMVTIAFKFCH